MEYDVIVNRTLKDLIADVKTHTSQGWQLQGGISVNANFYCQAIVKHELFSRDNDTTEIMKAAWTPPKPDPTAIVKRSHKKKT